MNMTFTIIVIAALLLTACGGSNKNTTETKNPTGTIHDDATTLAIDGNYHTATVNSVAEKTISVIGSNNIIYIQTPIDTLDILGSNNIIEIFNGVTVNDCSVSGIKNHAQKQPAQYTWLTEDNGNIRGVIIGDSIAEGHPSFHGRLHNAAGSFDDTVFNQQGQPSWELSKLTGYYWWNHGIGGQNSSQILARWSRDVLAIPNTTLPQQPYFVWVSIGINDIVQMMDTEVTKNNLLSMAIIANENNILIGFNTIATSNALNQEQRDMQNDINNFITNILPQHGAHIFDFNKWLSDPLYPTKVNPLLSRDGTHPTISGYTNYIASLVAHIWKPLIDESFAKTNFSCKIEGENNTGFN